MYGNSSLAMPGGRRGLCVVLCLRSDGEDLVVVGNGDVGDDGRGFRIEPVSVSTGALDRVPDDCRVMRSAPHYLLLGQTFSPRPPELKEQETTRWRQVVRRYRQLMRTGLAPGIVLSARYLFGVREMVTQFALDQCNWHRGFANRHLHYYRGLVRIGVWAFIAELLFALAHVLFHAPAWRPALLVSTCKAATFGFATAIAVLSGGSIG
jgi:hypothetical protein